MKVYPSDAKDWSTELDVRGKRIQPSHPYDLERDDNLAFWLYLFFPVGWVLRIICELIF